MTRLSYELCQLHIMLSYFGNSCEKLSDIHRCIIVSSRNRKKRFAALNGYSQEGTTPTCVMS